MEDITKETYDRIKEDENVSHPSHYTWLKELCGIEVIDITRHMDFFFFFAIKYILRAGRKPINKSNFNLHIADIQDLKKALFYINDKINMLEDEYNNINKH